MERHGESGKQEEKGDQVLMKSDAVHDLGRCRMRQKDRRRKKRRWPVQSKPETERCRQDAAGGVKQDPERMKSGRIRAEQRRLDEVHQRHHRPVARLDGHFEVTRGIQKSGKIRYIPEGIVFQYAVDVIVREFMKKGVEIQRASESH